MKLDELVKKMGKSVEESKPYWEARRLARQVTSCVYTVVVVVVVFSALRRDAC